MKRVCGSIVDWVRGLKSLVKPPVLVTYLRTMWKLTEQNRDDLARWKLVEGRQTIKNISDHLSKCKRAGLLWRKDNKHKVSETDFFSSPSYTVVRNPSHKVWIERYDNIDETTAFNLLLFMGINSPTTCLKKRSTSHSRIDYSTCLRRWFYRTEF